MNGENISVSSPELISIITPTYNCGKFIPETILSVQRQSYIDWEMLIVDDCSTDNTEEVVQYFQSKDPRIKYFRFERNAGAAAARNFAIAHARGRWIAFLDSDDLWLPGKLERQLSFMKANNYAFSYHRYHEISETGDDLGILVSGIKKVTPLLMKACCWPGCLTVMYDQNKIGSVEIENIAKNNDTALWLKIIKKSDCFLLPEDLAAYRRRSGSITPPSLFHRIKAHYPLFRKSEYLGRLTSCFWVVINVFGNGIKKLFFVSKIP